MFVQKLLLLKQEARTIRLSALRVALCDVCTSCLIPTELGPSLMFIDL